MTDHRVTQHGHTRLARHVGWCDPMSDDVDKARDFHAGGVIGIIKYANPEQRASPDGNTP